jgi:glutathione synthase/RimK-type ligase-like ATP-grasp enzyme
MSLQLALATAVPAFALDEDLPLLLAACGRAGIDVAVLAWDDPTVSWARFDAVLLRSTWDYTARLAAFLAWCDRASGLTRLVNPPSVVRWNTDKRYLGELVRAGAPVIPCHFLAPGDDPAKLPMLDELVVKPTVGAGSRGARRFVAAERAQAIAHARTLLDSGLHVLAQPYLTQVDEAGETALLYFGGEFSHAIRKAPLLRRGGDATRALFAAEHIGAREPSKSEHAAAGRVLSALPFPMPLYARVDLLPSADGPLLLELELTEPSLFLGHGDGAADRLVAALLAHLRDAAPGP